MKSFFFTTLLIISVFNLHAQVGIGTTTPDASSELHILSTSKGILIPKLSDTERGNIVDPANGLIIYNTSTNILQVNTGTITNPVWSSMVVSKGTASTGIYALGKVNSDGTSAAINNATASKITTNNNSNQAAGDYQVTFTTPLPNNNYIIQLTIPDCLNGCPGGAGTNDDPGITYYDQQPTGFKVNIGDNDNGAGTRDDYDSEFMFTVFVIN